MKPLRAGLVRMLGGGDVGRGEDLLEDLRDLYRERRQSGLLRALARGAWDIASLVVRGQWLQHCLPDLRAGFRYWSNRPGLAATSVLTLGLGLGAGVTVYGVASSILLTPLPYPFADRLAMVWNTYPSWQGDPFLRGRWDVVPLSWPEYVDVRERAESIEAIALYAVRPLTVTFDGVAERVDAATVSASFFELIGARTILGRTFRPEEDEAAANVAVIRHDLWQSRLGGRPDIVGQFLEAGGDRIEIVGVLAPGATFQAESVWRPVGLDAPDNSGRDKHLYDAVARLRPDVDVAAAADELRPLLLGSRPPESMGTRLVPLLDSRVGGVRGPILLVFACAVLLMMIASINVSGLMVGDLVGRGSELAIKQALGASRWRLAREVIGADILLAAAGGAAATVVAALALPMLARVLPSDMPRLDGIGFGMPVVVMAAVTALAAALLCSLTPLAVLASRRWTRALRPAGRTVVTGGRWQAGLVSGQVAITLVLLVVSTLLVLTFVALDRIEPGFRAAGLVTARLLPPAVRYQTSESVRDLYRTLAARAAAIPTVTAVATTSNLPFGDPPVSTSIELSPGSPDVRVPEVQLQAISPGYLGTLGIPLREGRDLGAADGPQGAGAVVVSETMARDYFDGRALNRQFAWNERAFTVVGVAGDVLYQSLADEFRPLFYASVDQVSVRNRWLIVRTVGDPAMVAGELNRLVRSVDGQIVVSRVTSVPSLIGTTLEPQRFRMTLVSLFAVAAALLCFVSIHATSNRFVTDRRREIGVRLALGAGRRDVTWMLCRQSVRLVAWGVAVGGLAAAASAKAAGAMLFGVSVLDPTMLALVSVLVVMLVGGATIRPVRRALRVDPVVAIRESSL